MTLGEISSHNLKVAYHDINMWDPAVQTILKAELAIANTEEELKIRLSTRKRDIATEIDAILQ